MTIEAALNVAAQREDIYIRTLELHARALACHCECLGMNAENSFAICLGKNIPYDNDSYIIAMQKWGLTDKKR